MKEIKITREYLKSHPNHIFVFGDNIARKGTGGAAELRDEPNTYGLITKKFPAHNDDCYYKPSVYQAVYQNELHLLKLEIQRHPEKTYLISKLGAGLANKYQIFEKVIEPSIKTELAGFGNVKFLW